MQLPLFFEGLDFSVLIKYILLKHVHCVEVNTLMPVGCYMYNLH